MYRVAPVQAVWQRRPHRIRVKPRMRKLATIPIDTAPAASWARSELRFADSIAIRMRRVPSVRRARLAARKSLG
jgi:hypothetical protein